MTARKKPHRRPHAAARRCAAVVGSGLVAAMFALGCTPAVAPPSTRPTLRPAKRDAAQPPATTAATTIPPAPAEPPRVLIDPGSGVHVAWAGAAADAVVAGEHLVVLQPQGDHLHAVSWRDGEARWRVALPTTDTARLYSLGDRIVVHDRDTAIIVEAARGRILGRRAVPHAGRDSYGHRATRVGDTCAWRSACGIQRFSCDDGTLQGPYYASAEEHLYGLSDDPSEHSTSCSPDPRIVGQLGNTSVLVANVPVDLDAGGTGATAPSLVGFESDTDAVLWQHPLTAFGETVGETSDGGVWAVDIDESTLRVFDGSTGDLRWERSLGPGLVEAEATAGEIIVARFNEGRWRLGAYATADGKNTWRTRLSRRQRPLLPSRSIANAASLGQRRIYAIVDPERRGVAGELVAGRDERLLRDPAGGFVLVGAELREVDAHGRLLRQRPFANTNVQSVTPHHVLALDDEVVTLFDRDQLRQRARVEGGVVMAPTEGLPSDRLLFRRYGDDGVALLLRLDKSSPR